MNHFSRRSPVLFMLCSFVFALILNVMPLWNWMRWLRPDWVVLVTIFWILALPEFVGVGMAWLAGLILDEMGGTLLGEHALALVLVAYLVARFYPRIRQFPFWQMNFTVLGLVMIYRAVIFWVQGVLGHVPSGIHFWLPALMSMIVWPFVSSLLKGFGHVNFALRTGRNASL